MRAKLSIAQMHKFCSYHSIGLHSEAFISQSHANLRIAFSASLLVAVSFSANYFSNCAGMIRLTE